MGPKSVGSHFRVICKLGEGSFAEVFKAKSLKTDAIYAIKRLKKRYRSVAEVHNLPEIVSLNALQGHPNVVTLIDVLFDSENGYVAMVFEMLDSNLYEYVRDRHKPLDEQTTLLFVYQLLKAVAAMHAKGMFHRDIKPENCMVKHATLELKLVDFGSTRTDTNALPYTEYVSTRWYRAPECILTSGSYGKEVDIWAIGCMLYEMMTTKPLFPGKHEIDQIARIHAVVGSPSRDILAQFRQNPNTQISFSFPSKKPQDFHRLIPNCSENTLDLMRKMLIYDPRTRITAQEALDHPVFETLRRADEMWQQSDMKLPFPVFLRTQFMKVQSPRPEPPLPAAIKPNITYQPPNAELVKEQIQHPKPALPAYPPPNPAILNQPPGLVAGSQIHIEAKPKQTHAPLIAPKPPPPKQVGNFNLEESRRKAIQRIKEFNKKVLARNHQKQQKQPVFQKPRPEIVQPRLPQLKPPFH